MYGHQYTGEEKKFLGEFIPGHTYLEIQETFVIRFGWDISLNQIKGYMANHKINSGTKGRFKKGRVPANKGMKGICAAGCEKTWFKKGHIPVNRRPVGSERINADGYLEIKVAEPNKWKPKHRVVWERVNGAIPKNSVIIFADGDKQNVSVDNLRMIDRGTHAVMNHEGLCGYSAEFKDTAIAISNLKRQMSTMKKRT